MEIVKYTVQFYSPIEIPEHLIQEQLEAYLTDEMYERYGHAMKEGYPDDATPGIVLIHVKEEYIEQDENPL